MTPAELPLWIALIFAGFLLTGAGLTLIGCFGLLRLDNFYKRVHAPTLGATFGTGCILIASMLYFSALQSRPILHEILIATFLTLTVPVGLILLVRATQQRPLEKGGAAPDSLAHPAKAADPEKPEAADR